MKFQGFQIRLGTRGSIIVLVVLVALYCVRWSREYTLSPDTLDSIRTRLQADYTRPILPDVRSATTSREELQSLAKRLGERQDVKLEAVSAKGLLWPKYVRVKVSVHGQPPPDGKAIRYFRISPLGTLDARYSNLDYYLNLW